MRIIAPNTVLAPSMDREFWIKRWQSDDTGFHRAKPHPLLVRHWPELALPPQGRVFVPLCGKSFDMVWLRDQGHHVVGSELSPIAVDAFFRELGLAPLVERDGGLTRNASTSFDIWQGDVFDLTLQHLGAIDAVYDRAALVALPRDIQGRYIDFLKGLMPAGGVLFLIALAYDQSEMDGPPFSIPRQEVIRLTSDGFQLDYETHNPHALDESTNLKKRGLTALAESLYVFRKTGDSKGRANT